MLAKYYNTSCTVLSKPTVTLITYASMSLIECSLTATVMSRLISFGLTRIFSNVCVKRTSYYETGAFAPVSTLSFTSSLITFLIIPY